MHTAADIQNIKAEVEKLTRFHEERAAVYNKLKEWKELWAEKVGYENHANEKSYYQNRGGQLQTLLQVIKLIYIDSDAPYDVFLRCRKVSVG